MPTDRSDGWITIQHAADYLSLSPDSIRRMISRGEIEARRFGPRLIRINLASLIANAEPLQQVGGAQ